MTAKQPIRERNVSVYFAVTGEGQPMLLLHGALRDSGDFHSLLPSLAKRWRVIAPDFRGHGQSPWADGNYHVADYVEDALAVLQGIQDTPAIIVGHSLGAMVAAAVAAELPRQVRAIVLEDPPFETMGSRIGETALLAYFQQIQQLAVQSLPVEELADALANVRLVDPVTAETTRLGDTRDCEAIRLYANCLHRGDPRVLSSIVAGTWLKGYDVESVFRRIECPVLLLQGNLALGGMLTEADATSVSAWCRNCTHIRLPDVGHHIHSTLPETMLRLVQSFVDSLPTVKPDHEIPSPHLRTHSHEDSARRHGHSQRTTG